MLLPLLLIAALAVAYANGANASFKGVASLFGSGTARYWPAVLWATLTTAAGCLTAAYGGSALLQAFTGKGLVAGGLAAQPVFIFSVAAGAALANLLATWLGFPVSTTHLLIGGLIGAGLTADPHGLNAATLWETFARPLLIAPVLALALGAVLYLILKPLRLVPDQRHAVLDALHYLSAGAVCFARGWNDTPKMAALLMGLTFLGTPTHALLLIALSMTLGGLISAKHVADTLAHKITDMNPGQGFTANLATALLVILGTLKGLPLSTTHVSVGALLGIGITTRQAKWKTALPVLLAWVITLPCAGVLSAVIYVLGTLI